VGGTEAEGVVEAEAFIVCGRVEVSKSQSAAVTRLSNQSTGTTMTMMTATLGFLSLARTTTLPCRRILITQFIAPNSTPLLSDKSLLRRTFVSTLPRRAAPVPPPPATPTILRRSPTVEDIETAELDVELLSQGDAQLTLTERAAEVSQSFTSHCQQVLTCCVSG